MRLLRVLLVLLPFFGQAQSYDSVAWSHAALSEVYWPKAASPSVPFQFTAVFTLAEKQLKSGRTLHEHFYVEPRWIRSQSFVADSLRDLYLPLAQLYFDWYELEARKAQEVINTARTSGPSIVTGLKERADQYVEHIRTITEEGKNTVEMQKMRQYIDSALNATPRIDVPEWKEERFGLGFDLGSGASAFYGNLQNYFGAVSGYALGGGFHIHPFYLDIRLLAAETQSKLGFTQEDFKFTDSSRLQLRQASLNVGVRLFNHPKWAVVPFLGFTTFRIINRDEPKASLYGKGPASVNLEGGLLAEWRFLPVYQNNQLLFSMKLIFRTSYAITNYLYSIDGSTLKFQIGIGFNVNEIRNIAPGEN